MTYTGFVVDLVDSVGTNHHGTAHLYPRVTDGFDNVEGYELEYLERQLKGQANLEDWRDRIVQNSNNSMKNCVKILYNYWKRDDPPCWISGEPRYRIIRSHCGRLIQISVYCDRSCDPGGE